MPGKLFIKASLLKELYVQEFVEQNPDKTLVILAPKENETRGLLSKTHSDKDTQNAHFVYKNRKHEVTSSLEYSDKMPAFFLSDDISEIQKSAGVTAVFISPKFGADFNRGILEIAQAEAEKSGAKKDILQEYNSDAAAVSEYLETIKGLGILKESASQEALFSAIHNRDDDRFKEASPKTMKNIRNGMKQSFDATEGVEEPKVQLNFSLKFNLSLNGGLFKEDIMKEKPQASLQITPKKTSPQKDETPVVVKSPKKDETPVVAVVKSPKRQVRFSPQLESPESQESLQAPKSPPKSILKASHSQPATPMAASSKTGEKGPNQ